MKLAIAAVLSIPLGLLLTLTVVAGGASTADTHELQARAAAACAGTYALFDGLTDAVRTVETGGDYSFANQHRSGAYALTDIDWANAWNMSGLAGPMPARPVEADPDTQDYIALVRLGSFDIDPENGLAQLAILWANNTIPTADDPIWDQPIAGTQHQLTLRAYQHDFIDAIANASIDQQGIVDQCRSRGLGADPGDITLAGDAQYAIPHPRESITLRDLQGPHHHYPAVDILVPEGTPIYAVTGGVVVRTTSFDQNWWRAGCRERDVNGCKTCGVGVSVQASDGSRWAYCHFSSRTVDVGDIVETGQGIGLSGDTGRSGAPHLHIEVSANGERRCPQPMLVAAWEGRLGPAPADIPTNIACFFIPAGE